jgi:hypothetical protein
MPPFGAAFPTSAALFFWNLERLKKYGSHSALKNEDAVFLVFGFRLRQGCGGQVVLAQLQGFETCAFAKALPKTKILAANWL